MGGEDGYWLLLHLEFPGCFLDRAILLYERNCEIGTSVCKNRYVAAGSGVVTHIIGMAEAKHPLNAVLG